tara:strand:+ start:2868 stop:4640 length:1773 start_codon:yes stop_codon:yes gene_type:complete
MKDNNHSSTDEAQQLEQLRQLLLGKNNQRIRDIVEEDARKVVSNVVAEALHDRQTADGMVGQVLAPLVEEAVEQSITTRKEQFVGYMYPLVGRLVRKSVSAFLASFVEQTNQLLENNFTLKGIKWRFKAWRTGVTYSQYVVSQTYLFRVEQVFLIHSDTSMLLKTVIRDQTQAADADLVSAMLTAINDFVSDSFSKDENNKQHLDEIKTDNFTLLIKQGPQAMLVAAITGNAPADIGEMLQLNLEKIHKIYADELQNFDGDALPFENTELLLNKCLVAKQIESDVSTKKLPWMAITLFIVILSGVGFFLFKQWQFDSKIQQIQSLDNSPGIILLNVEQCKNSICIELLRDPIAQSSISWLKRVDFSDINTQITEHTYHSLDVKLNQKRLNTLIKKFPELTYNETDGLYHGKLIREDFIKLNGLISALSEQLDIDKALSAITIHEPAISVSENKKNQILIQQKINNIEQASISFNNNQSTLSATARGELKYLSVEIASIIKLVDTLNYKVKIIIMGASDPIGADTYNQQLSIKRAQSVKNELINNGVDQNVIQSVGLGKLETSTDARRVLFAVVKVTQKKRNSEITKKVQE